MMFGEKENAESKGKIGERKRKFEERKGMSDGDGLSASGERLKLNL